MQATITIIPFILLAEGETPPLMNPHDFLGRRLHCRCPHRRGGGEGRGEEHHPDGNQEPYCAAGKKISDRVSDVDHDVILSFRRCPVKAIVRTSSGESPLRI